MKRMIFVNLPVTDLAVATDVLHRARLRPERATSPPTSAAASSSPTRIFVMLLVRDRFADFTAGPVGDARTSTTVINCLSAVSRRRGRRPGRQGPDRTAASPGWTRSTDGPMYGHSFADPDGHVWEVLFMEMTG